MYNNCNKIYVSQGLVKITYNNCTSYHTFTNKVNFNVFRFDNEYSVLLECDNISTNVFTSKNIDDCHKLIESIEQSRCKLKYIKYFIFMLLTLLASTQYFLLLKVQESNFKIEALEKNQISSVNTVILPSHDSKITNINDKDAKFIEEQFDSFINNKGIKIDYSNIKESNESPSDQLLKQLH